LPINMKTRVFQIFGRRASSKFIRDLLNFEDARVPIFGRRASSSFGRHASSNFLQMRTLKSLHIAIFIFGLKFTWRLGM
jgi:hypothetical protein